MQMQLSQILKTFSPIFTLFPKSAFNFDHFEKKDEPHSLCFCEIIDGERHAYVNV